MPSNRVMSCSMCSPPAFASFCAPSACVFVSSCTSCFLFVVFPRGLMPFAYSFMNCGNDLRWKLPSGRLNSPDIIRPDSTMWMAISAGVREVGVGRNVSETSGRFLISLMTPERVYCQASRASSRAVVKAMKEEFYAFSPRPRKDRRSPRHRDRYILIARQRAVIGARPQYVCPWLRERGGDDEPALGRDGRR